MVETLINTSSPARSVNLLNVVHVLVRVLCFYTKVVLLFSPSVDFIAILYHNFYVLLFE